MGLMFFNGSSVEQISSEFGCSPSDVMFYKREPKFDEHFFDIIDTEAKAYFLGLLFADGCNCSNNNDITIGLKEDDSYVLENLASLLRLDRKLLGSPRQKILRMCSNHMSGTLSSHGMVPRKSLILKFPECVPPHLIRHFIRGYSDGDGCIHISKNGPVWSITSTEDFCTSLRDIVEAETGVAGYIYVPHKDPIKPTRVFTIAGMLRVPKSLKWIYSGSHIHLYRKFDKYEEAKYFDRDVYI